MKNTLLVLSMVVLALNTHAQEQQEFQKHQFSINATSFTKNFLSFNSNSAPEQPYQFMYRYMKENGTALRVQMGLNFFKSTVKEDDDVSEISFSNTSLAVGLEKRNAISNRWLYYFGVQGLFDYELQLIENSSGSLQSSSKDVSYHVGLGGVVGVQFNINNRISLGTEGGLPIMYTNSTSTNTSDNDTDKSTGEFVTLAPTLPNSLYLNITF